MLVSFIALTAIGLAPESGVILEDSFGRDITQRGIDLVDWEGPIANPAPTVYFVATDRLYRPAKITVTSKNPLIQFALFSTVGEGGTTKTVFLDLGLNKASLRLSAWPSLERYEGTLKVKVEDANEHVKEFDLPVRVGPVPALAPPKGDPPLNIPTDYSEDPTAFFKQEDHRTIIEQAADAWRFYLGNPGFDAVPAGKQVSWIFDATTFSSGHDAKVKKAYTGYYLFVQGIKVDDHRSTGIASFNGDLQTMLGKATGLKRSGTVAIETTGNYNQMGWLVLPWDQAYWRASCQSDVQHDLYSIARHEMGHALGFHKVHPAFNDLIKSGVFQGQATEAYFGKKPSVNPSEHFDGVIDPVSGVGVFGNEYGGLFPRKRWILTKFDLMVMKDIGYGLQNRAPFWPLQAQSADKTVLKADGTWLALRIGGGIPPYYVTVSKGELPPGCTLDSFTGQLLGKTSGKGQWPVSLAIEDAFGGKATVQTVFQAL